jgi:hypothetical protein
LRSHHDFPAANRNGISLLKIIKTLTYTFEEFRNLADALSDIKKTFYIFKQGKHMSIQQYHDSFLAHVEVMKAVGATIADTSLVEEEAKKHTCSGSPTKSDHNTADERAHAIRFIQEVNAQHEDYLKHLHNSYLHRTDVYPTILHQAYYTLQCQEGDNTPILPSMEGIAFAQSNKETITSEQNNTAAAEVIMSQPKPATPVSSS